MALPRKKPPAAPVEDDFALLLGGEEESLDDGLEGGEYEADEFAEEDDFGDELGGELDPLAGEEDMGSEIDPEMASLAETLGFTEPDQQQALIDLIKLVSANSAEPAFPESSI
jgi:hypothetical protein